MKHTVNSELSGPMPGCFLSTLDVDVVAESSCASPQGRRRMNSLPRIRE